MTTRVVLLQVATLWFVGNGCSAQTLAPRQSTHGSRSGVVRVAEVPTAPRATWRLEWDDRVDGVVQAEPKSCQLLLSFGDSKVEGMFSGPVFGLVRRAHFIGDQFGGAQCRLLLLRQLEGDYVCSYQLQSSRNGVYVGVWHDNRGRSGDVRLRRTDDVWI